MIRFAAWSAFYGAVHPGSRGEEIKTPMSRFEVPDHYARNIREAEASSRLEGIDTSGNLLLGQLKAQILAGEISVDEACDLYTGDIRRRVAEQERCESSFPYRANHDAF